jgi:hypothetical protein
VQRRVSGKTAFRARTGMTLVEVLVVIAIIDLPPLNVATFRERISGGTNQGRSRDATREEVHCGADHREAPRG